MRGLVFGPTRREVELSASGKRLRVEKASSGRTGDLALRDEDESLAETNSTPSESRDMDATHNGVGEDLFVHARVKNGTEVVHVIVVYAAPTVGRRSGLWEVLSQSIHGVEEPVIMGGDFNTIVRLDERTGGNGRLSPDSLSFGEWINANSLIDMGFKGNRYNWRRGRVAETFIAKLLDRILCCPQARLKWQEAVVSHLPFMASDHAPLYLQLCPEVKGNPQRRPFRFEAAWLSHRGFKELVSTSWNGELVTPEALQRLTTILQKWNREVFGDINRRKDTLIHDIKVLQDQLDLNQTDDLLSEEDKLMKELDVVLEQEEVSLVPEVEGKMDSVGRQELNSALTALNRPFLATEVEFSIRCMGKYKAPGPDGFQPIFYQHCWDMVGTSVTRFVLDFFETGVLPRELNDALVVLIAKVVKPENMAQFRPISLCNVLFKIITKMMVLRLKTVMPKLIGPAQASFIPVRLSTDNIVIVQEAVHSMRRKNGRKGWMLLKLDLEKAYDRVRWDFLEDTLKVAGLSTEWRNWILQCVVGPSMTVLWNGEKTIPFTPSRGLRQGDPLSPYLFVMCLERLCHLIEISVNSKEWKPISLSRGGPKLSHICFADDLILFAEAYAAQIRIIRKVMESFCVASGQKDLGKYLGMPILHKRIKKETFRQVIERVNSRLSGWKGRFLSFAERLTLTKAVLSSIPVHAMSTISLPKHTLNKLDQISKSFLWGSTLAKRKQHLVAWSRSSMWARVFRSKYRVGDPHDKSWLVVKSHWSSTWRSVSIGLREVVMPGLSWIIGDGREIRFWLDKWLANKPLIDMLVGEPPVGYENVRACEAWRNGMGWSDSLILRYLTDCAKLQLRAVVIDNVTGASDRLSWGGSLDGRFSVQSAYAVLTRNDKPRQDMTLFSRGYGRSKLQNVCLGDNVEQEGYSWATQFVVVIWWAWKWRCGNIFESTARCRDRVGGRVRPNRGMRMIAWSPPSVGWVKLNTDGASHGNPGLATAGGVLRDSDGAWIGGFAFNIGICTAPLAELWGVYYGLYTAWEKGITRVELEVDSELVVGFLTTVIEDSHPLSFLVRLCYDFISRDWIVRIGHMYREANRLADGLANYALLLPLGFHSFVLSLEPVRSIVLQDLVGFSLPRSVCL
ncbi:PREDICTED: uncharacterized protein LOC104763089 [Camelina sativa]|uniref:Uncharacterized protein LOC104763089 n=1 Tax=Camelina sativa TaxID=90675 RepID=A0ABM0XEM8_CAMSA|nr:PREDICTED: uncharacterized protein LOC104763089 [Camelina sativa]